MELYEKALKVIEGCRVVDHLHAARAYLRLASRHNREIALSDNQREALWSALYDQEIKVIG